MVRGEQSGAFIASLQALRALAAISVLLFHAAAGLPANAGFDLVKSICLHGFVGVDVFFVLSGFVVMHTASRVRSASDGRAFALRRFGRIYLGYWPVLLLGVALSMLGIPALNAAGQWWPSALLVEPTMERNVLPVAYTLVYELWFYALTAGALALIASDARRKQLLWAAVFLLLSWQVALIATSFDAWSKGQVPLPFAMSGIHLEFLAGALTYVYSRHMTTIAMRFVGGTLIAIGLVALVWYWQLFGLTLVRALIGGALGVGAVLLALSASKPGNTRRGKGFLETLGDASFSLYLLHTLILTTVSVVASKLVARGSASVEGVVVGVAVVLSIIVARAWYVWLERPLYLRWCALLARHARGGSRIR